MGEEATEATEATGATGATGAKLIVMKIAEIEIRMVVKMMSCHDWLVCFHAFDGPCLAFHPPRNL